MFGKTELIQFSITVFSLAAALQDLKWRKIFNFFNITVAGAGFFVSFYFDGGSGLLTSLHGLAAGLFLFGWMFALRILGGGDVKFLMALGCWGGWRYTAEVALLSILVGGFFSLVILVVKKRLITFIRNFYLFLVSILISELDFLPLSVDSSLTMPFGVPISISAIWVIFYHPLKYGFDLHWL